MLNYTCKYCGGVLRIREGRMGAQCTTCGRYYSSDAIYTIAQKSAPETVSLRDAAKSTKIIGIVIAAMFTFFLMPVSPVPFMLFLPAAFIIAGKAIIKEAEASEGDDLPRGAGEQLRSADDYLRAFRTMPLEYMPLREEANRAVMQIDALKRKQLALGSMLRQDHPFIKSGNDAAAYILRNLKQVLYRLRFCDQSDPELRRMHAKYLRERLDENDRILRDFENLIIEVTQLSDDTAVTAPSLDVLAATLHSVNTGEELPPHCELSAPADDRYMRI